MAVKVLRYAHLGAQGVFGLLGAVQTRGNEAVTLLVVGKIVDADRGIARLKFGDLLRGIVFGQVLHVTHAHGVGLPCQNNDLGLLHDPSPPYDRLFTAVSRSPSEDG